MYFQTQDNYKSSVICDFTHYNTLSPKVFKKNYMDVYLTKSAFFSVPNNIQLHVCDRQI